MSFTYLTNLPLEQAQRDYPLWLAEGGFAPKTERLPPAGLPWWIPATRCPTGLTVW